jgi:hypothetical protein
MPDDSSVRQESVANRFFLLFSSFLHSDLVILRSEEKTQGAATNSEQLDKH